MLELVRRFVGNNNGNFAVTFAVAAAPLLGAMALGADYVNIHQTRSGLQELADAAALATVREMSLSNSKSIDIQSVAESYAKANFRFGKSDQIVVEATPDRIGTSVDIKISYSWQPFFAHFIDKSALPIVVNASAGSTGGKSSLCVVGLDTANDLTINIGSKSSVTANGCALYSNSKSPRGLNADSNATMQADSIQTAGGYFGSDKNYSPLPITDAPAVADPLINRVAPSVGPCDQTNFSIKGNVAQTLYPGVYCNGLDIGGKAIANLEPGIYIIKDGPLSIRGNASLIGDHVGFYFTGTNAVFDFAVSTQAVLSAPKTGPLSGILFFEDRNSPQDRVFTIRSKDAEKFEGTVYLPNGVLYIDKASRVGQLSKWTAIIAKRFEVGKGPQLVINSDYSGSDVPVPEGIASKSQVRLLK